MKYWDTAERDWRDVLRCLTGRHKITQSEPDVGIDRCSCGAIQFDADGNWSLTASVGRRSARRAAKNAEDRKRFRAQILASFMGPEQRG